MISLKGRLSVIRSRLFNLLHDCCNLDDISVMPKRPVHLSEYTVLQPDVVVARGNLRTYADHHPSSEETLVVVEISRPHVSLSDRLPFLAKALVPEYWFVNTVDRSVEVYTEPSAAGYDQVHVYREGKSISLSFAPGKSISVTDIVALG